MNELTGDYQVWLYEWKCKSRVAKDKALPVCDNDWDFKLLRQQLCDGDFMPDGPYVKEDSDTDDEEDSDELEDSDEEEEMDTKWSEHSLHAKWLSTVKLPIKWIECKYELSSE